MPLGILHVFWSVFLCCAASYSDSLSGGRVFEVLREKDALFYSGFSVALACYRGPEFIADNQDNNPLHMTMQVTGRTNEVVSVAETFLNLGDWAAYIHDGQRHKLTVTNEVLVLNGDGSTSRFIGSTSELATPRSEGSTNPRTLAGDVWNYATPEHTITVSIFRPLLLLGRGYTKWIYSLELLSLNATTGVAHLTGPGSLFLGDRERKNPIFIGIWNLWVDTHNDFLVKKATFKRQNGSGYLFEPDNNAGTHFNPYMGLLFYNKGNLSIGNHFIVEVTLQSLTANADEQLFSFARKAIERPPEFSTVRDYRNPGLDGKLPSVSTVRYR